MMVLPDLQMTKPPVFLYITKKKQRMLNCQMQAEIVGSNYTLFL